MPSDRASPLLMVCCLQNASYIRVYDHKKKIPSLMSYARVNGGTIAGSRETINSAANKSSLFGEFEETEVNRDTYQKLGYTPPIVIVNTVYRINRGSKFSDRSTVRSHALSRNVCSK